MSRAITSGLLSNPKSDQIPVIHSLWLDLGNIIGQIAPQFEVVEIHPEREEILLKTHYLEPSYFNSIRNILQSLQQRTQRSFVALMSPNRQHVLITVRG